MDVGALTDLIRRLRRVEKHLASACVGADLLPDEAAYGGAVAAGHEMNLGGSAVLQQRPVAEQHLAHRSALTEPSGHEGGAAAIRDLAGGVPDDDGVRCSPCLSLRTGDSVTAF